MPKTRMNIAIDPVVKAALDQEAGDDERSRSDLAEELLRQGLAAKALTQPSVAAEDLNRSQGLLGARGSPLEPSHPLIQVPNKALVVVGVVCSNCLRVEFALGLYEPGKPIEVSPHVLQDERTGAFVLERPKVSTGFSRASIGYNVLFKPTMLCSECMSKVLGPELHDLVEQERLRAVANLRYSWEKIAELNDRIKSLGDAIDLQKDPHRIAGLAEARSRAQENEPVLFLEFERERETFIKTFGLEAVPEDLREGLDYPEAGLAEEDEETEPEPDLEEVE